MTVATRLVEDGGGGGLPGVRASLPTALCGAAAGVLESGAANPGPIFVLGSFFVVHLLRHVLRRDLPENMFGSVPLILEAGASAAIDLMPIV